MGKAIAVATVALLCLGSPAAAAADEPDAVSVEWRGQHPCEKLYEDAQIRVARCTFPPGAVHLRHKHPGYLSYVLEGGKGKAVSVAGTRMTETQAGDLLQSAPVPWHEFSNVGDTTIRYLVIEKKYEPVKGD